MTTAAQLNNPAKESSRAGFGKPEIHAQVLEQLERVAPGCGPVFGPVSESDAKHIHPHAFKGAFTVTFTGAERRIVIFEMPYMARCLWVTHDYRTARTRKPKAKQWVDCFKLLADNMAYDLRDDTRRTAETAGPLELIPGDVVYSSWGYEQTNVDFYKVLRISASGQSATIVPIGQERTEKEFAMSGTTVPLLHIETGEPTTHRKYDRNSLIGWRYAGALLSKWDGTPRPYTCYA